MTGWNKMKLPEGAKLFKIHNFTYMWKGATYHLEVDEFADGSFTGHGEHSTDKSRVLESVSGKSIEDCLNALTKNVK
jgi:hypothetical protein